MDKKEAKTRIEKLRTEINHHRYLYHVLDKQEISDAAQDSLKHELFKLEQQFPDLVTPDSPTQRVGGQPLSSFKKVPHKSPMLSLEDIFNESEFSDWVKRIYKLTQGQKPNFFGELKIDGFAVSLIYKKGLLEIGSTRGDGRVGEDITVNLKTIEAIPLRLVELKEADLKKNGFEAEKVHRAVSAGELEVRGEVFMTKATFQKINREQKRQGLAEYANPRNTAAGSIRQLDPAVAAQRDLSFLAYDLVTDVGQKNHSQEHTLLKLFGFKTDQLAAELGDETAVNKFWYKVKKQREKLAWEIDGIVISVDSNQLFGKLGVAGKAPRGAVALKFPGKESTTKIKNIVIQVGRTGVLTPVAVLEPTDIGGVTVTRATLHNEDEIRRLDIRIGDTVIVQRAGDVIPDVVKILKNLRPKSAREFNFPRRCPVCRHDIVRPRGEAAHRCANKKCSAQHRENLYHFVSKKAFNIVGLGPEIIDKVVDAGLVKTAADIFKIKPKDLLELEGFAEVSANKLVDSISKSKKIDLAKFIFALGIIHVGEETANLLASYFGGLKVIVSATAEELQKIPGIGEAAGKSISAWFKDKENKELIAALLNAGIEITAPKKINQKFKDLIFVFTGTLEHLTRDSARGEVRLRGGDVANSVSSKTDYVVAGENPGSKYNDAQKLGVKIISERDFLKMIK